MREGEVVVLTMEVEEDKEAVEEDKEAIEKKKGDVSHNGSDTI